MIRKLVSFSTTVLSVIMLVPAIASAHVIVTPSTAGVGEELIFNISSPNEQQTAIQKLTLDIPSGVSEVVPTEKDGWTITTTTNGSTSDPEITSITWSGGQIPVGQREDFGFGAQVPGSATNLDWKAYQTYADGTIVHWDQTPNGKDDDANGNAGPYSVTKVSNDLTVTPSTTTTTKSSSNTVPLIVALVALLLSVYGLIRRPATKS